MPNQVPYSDLPFVVQRVELVITREEGKASDEVISFVSLEIGPWQAD